MLGSTRSQYVAFKKYMRVALFLTKPSGVCQACLSYNTFEKDYLLTCDLCRSCIHNSHYGFDSNLQQPWKCQRCRYLLQHGPDTNITCHFCPNIKGIMKQHSYENEKVWLHPQCAVWGYPIIAFTNNKRNAIHRAKPKNDADLFWTQQLNKNQFPCVVCNGEDGYRIRCKYYSCHNSYHITCAITLGIVRDLESMRIQKTGSSYFPVYCREHIEKKVIDYRKRAFELQKTQKEKSVHFFKVSHLYEIQLKNLNEAAQKYKKEEKVIEYLNEKAEKTINEGKMLSFSDMDESYESNCPDQLLDLIENQMVQEGIKLKPLTEVKKQIEDKEMIDESLEREEIHRESEERMDHEQPSENPQELLNQLI